MTKYIVFFLLCVGKISSSNSQPFPKMVIFGLDKTLWPNTVGVDAIPPFKIQNISVSDSDVVDSQGHVIKPYPATQKVLDYLMKNNIRMCISSKTKDPDGARQLCSLFGWNKYFFSKMMYSSTRKSDQIMKMSQRCKISFKDILFFDDKQNNIFDLERIKVVSYLLLHGMTIKDLMHGFYKYSDRNSGAFERKLYNKT